jgi:hypothetical protein
MGLCIVPLHFSGVRGLPADSEGRLYQAGVFFSWEPCGLGFRREKGIIHNLSQFAGHAVRAGFPES